MEDFFASDLGRDGCKILEFDEDDNCLFLELRGVQKKARKKIKKTHDIGSVQKARCGESAAMASDVDSSDDISEANSLFRAKEQKQDDVFRPRGHRSVKSNRTRRSNGKMSRTQEPILEEFEINFEPVTPVKRSAVPDVSAVDGNSSSDDDGDEMKS